MVLKKFLQRAHHATYKHNYRGDTQRQTIQSSRSFSRSPASCIKMRLVQWRFVITWDWNLAHVTPTLGVCKGITQVIIWTQWGCKKNVSERSVTGPAEFSLCEKNPSSLQESKVRLWDWVLEHAPIRFLNQINSVWKSMSYNENGNSEGHSQSLFRECPHLYFIFYIAHCYCCCRHLTALSMCCCLPSTPNEICESRRQLVD